MKLSKKAITALSFTIGTCIFISTAYADTLIGSGYDRLKDSVKNTAAQMEQGLGSYTSEMLFTLKDNGQTLLQISAVNKFDTEKRASEITNLTKYPNGKTEPFYSYSDKKQSIWKNGTDERYYVNEFPEELNRGNTFTSPFNEQVAPEIEKIVDAAVGNLKDYVQAEERPDGGREYSGSLSEAQVPAIVNAVSSFGMKRMISDQHNMPRDAKLPKIESDIFVKKVAGTAVENKAGILESLTADVILSGMDQDGVRHDLTLNVVFKLTNIGNTKITLPDLTGAKVEKASRGPGFSSSHVGTYKNNIVIEKDGQFVKIGERTLEILTVEQDKITGKYYETVKPGFEAEYPDTYSFAFEYNPDDTKSTPVFTYTNAGGEQENGQIHSGGNGKIYLQLNLKIGDNNSISSNFQPNYDGEFTRVFAE